MSDRDLPVERRVAPRSRPAAVRPAGRHARRFTAALAVGVGLLAGCAPATAPSAPPLTTAAAPESSTAARAGAAAPGPAAPARFTPCDGSFECATVPVPVDYAQPAGASLQIGVVRVPARDQARKLGVLLVNPGGPGGSGIELAESGQIPASVTDRFDVVGFDPRGVGRSDALACPVGPDTPYFGDPDPGDGRDEAATDAAVERYVRSCGDRYRDLLPHLGTRNVARDMDRIREALGQQQINYLGYSYGTAIGQAYGELFPTRLRTMVLDGVVDVSKPGLDSGQAESFENSLRQFAAQCAGDPGCPVRPDAIAVVDRVRARLAASPLPVAGSPTPLSAGLFELGVVLPLYSKDNWPVLAQALAAADRGDGGPMRRLAQRYFEGSNSDTYNAVTCLDSAWPRNDADVFAASRRTETMAPHFSGNVLVSGLTCAAWPVRADPLTPPTGTGLPPTLVIGTTNDPATPYQNSVALAGRLRGSALLTYRGDGHTVYGQGVTCVDTAVDRYLTDRTLPPTNTIC